MLHYWNCFKFQFLLKPSFTCFLAFDDAFPSSFLYGHDHDFRHVAFITYDKKDKKLSSRGY